MQNVGLVASADRLSNLLEELLYAILSLLPSWQAVQTCVLSERWRDFWRTMPCLHVDEPLHLEERRHGGSIPVFEDFTTNLLLLHESPLLDAFRLVVTSPSDHALQGWIRRAVTRRPAALEIQNRHPWLHIHELVLPIMDYSRYFGRLRRLHLCGVRIDGRFAEKLGSGCFPVMEDLDLELCRVDDQLSKIALQVVKNLTTPHRFVVTAPALVYLSCQGPNTISLRETAASRVKAPIYSYQRVGGLRKLHLCDVRLDRRFAANLGSNCPVLEDLQLRFCYPEFSRITLPAVTNLIIYFCENDLLIVAAPALIYVPIVPRQYYLASCDGSLPCESIRLTPTIGKDGHSAKASCQPLQRDDDIPVRFRHYGLIKTMFVDEPANGFPVFRNLKILSLQRCFSDWSDWSGKFTALGSFVQNAPKLKKLLLCNCAFSAWEENEIYETSTAAAQNQQLSRFRCKNLEAVQFMCYYDSDPRIPDIMEGILRTLGKCVLQFAITQGKAEDTDPAQGWGKTRKLHITGFTAGLLALGDCSRCEGGSGDLFFLLKKCFSAFSKEKNASQSTDSHLLISGPAQPRLKRPGHFVELVEGMSSFDVVAHNSNGRGCNSSKSEAVEDLLGDGAHRNRRCNVDDEDREFHGTGGRYADVSATGHDIDDVQILEHSANLLQLRNEMAPGGH
ncbi:hypothetical protein EJB05_37082, partial [Eragrostis curvula]